MPCERSCIVKTSTSVYYSSGNVRSALPPRVVPVGSRAMGDFAARPGNPAAWFAIRAAIWGPIPTLC
jgi:hypothetical protein